MDLKSELYFSNKTKTIYDGIIIKKRLKPENITDLYRLNLLLSRELYLVLNLLECAFKQKLHHRMTEIHNTTNWFNQIHWLPAQYETLREAVLRHRKITHPADLLDDLTLGFWRSLLSDCYQKEIFTPAIARLFTAGGSYEELSRSALQKAFTRVMHYRNAIAHCDVIINEERRLLNSYNEFTNLLCRLDGMSYQLVKKYCRFEHYYRILKWSPYSFPAWLHSLRYRTHRAFYMLLGKVKNRIQPYLSF